MATQPVAVGIRLPPRQLPVPRVATVPLTGWETPTATVRRPLLVHLSLVSMGAMLIQTIGEIGFVIVLLRPNRRSGVPLGVQLPLTPLGQGIATAPRRRWYRVSLRATICGTTPLTSREVDTAIAQRPQQIPHQLVRNSLYRSLDVVCS